MADCNLRNFFSVPGHHFRLLQLPNLSTEMLRAPILARAVAAKARPLQVKLQAAKAFVVQAPQMLGAASQRA
jgi:hypothetical protein